jgi:hypothetical protein
MKKLIYIVFLSISIISCRRTIPISQTLYMGMTVDDFYKNTQKCLSLGYQSVNETKETCIDIPTTTGNSVAATATPDFTNGKLTGLKLKTDHYTVTKEQVKGTFDYLVAKYATPDAVEKGKQNNVEHATWNLKSGLTVQFYGYAEFMIRIDYDSDYEFKDQFRTPEKPKSHI